ASDYDSDGYRLSDDFTPTDYEDGGTRNNSDRELKNFFGNLTLTPNDKSQVGLIINKITGERGVPPITLDRDDPFGKSPKYERVDDQDGLSMSLSGSYDFDSRLSFRGWAFMNDLEELKNGYDDDTYTTQTARNSYRAKEKTEIRGANLQTQYLLESLGKVSFTLGTKEEDFDSSGWEVGRNDTTYFGESHEITTHTVAAEYEVQTVTNLGFVAGYGYSWFKKEGGLDDKTGNYLVGFNYDFSKNCRIKASFADKVRFPSVTQLYGIGEGNPDLDYEKSKNYELGFEQNMVQIDTAFSVTGFRRDVKNYISKDADGINRNSEKYKFQGIEIMAKNRSVENLNMSLAYTYMDAKDKSTGTLVDQVQYNPEHKLALQGVYDFVYDISAYASIERIENQYYYNNDNTLKGKLPDYTIINLKVEKKFFSKALKIFAGADNLFDENYFESYALPRGGRSIYGGFTYSYK
ncbi:MAG: TonB-dependent receptor, partial [Desulfobacteraceae bacterium]